MLDIATGVWGFVATLVNEELDADWASINVEGGAGNVAAYGNLAWGGTDLRTLFVCASTRVYSLRTTIASAPLPCHDVAA